ncbi:Ras-GEF domain-containing protein [Entamoeba marina]
MSTQTVTTSTLTKVKRQTIGKSLGKAIELFEKNTNSKKYTSTSISPKIQAAVEDNFSFIKVEQLFKHKNYCIFDDVTICNHLQPRLIVWSLGIDSRNILEKICRRAVQVNYPKHKLYSLIFQQEEKFSDTAQNFITEITDNVNVVFSHYGDPTFNVDGSVLLATQDTFYELMFNVANSEDSVSNYMYSFPLFISPEELLDQFIATSNEPFINSDMSDKEFTHIMEKQYRLERAVQLFGNIMNPMEDSLKKKYNQYFSFMLESSHLSEDLSQNKEMKFPQMDKNLIQSPTTKSRHKKNNSLTILEVKSPYSSVDYSVFESQTIISNNEGVTFENILNYPPKVVAEQLIYFDNHMLQTIHIKELYNYNKSDEFNHYIEKLNVIELILLSCITEKQSFTFFIKTARICVDLNDMNMAHLIFSVIVKQSITHSSEFQVIDKDTKTIYDVLYNLFSISKNHSMYRSHYSFIDSSPFKIPVISIWLKDMIMYSNMPTTSEKFLNIDRLNKVAKHIEKLANTLKNRLKIPPIQTFQTFFDQSPN